MCQCYDERANVWIISCVHSRIQQDTFNIHLLLLLCMLLNSFSECFNFIWILFKKVTNVWLTRVRFTGTFIHAYREANTFSCCSVSFSCSILQETFYFCHKDICIFIKVSITLLQLELVIERLINFYQCWRSAAFLFYIIAHWASCVLDHGPDKTEDIPLD